MDHETRDHSCVVVHADGDGRSPAPARSLAASADDREEHAFTLEAGGKFSLDNINGDITVRASEGNRVQVVAVKKAKAMDQERAKEALSKLKVAIESSPEKSS